MVGISYDRRFKEPVRTGIKRQTFRVWKRKPKVGEKLQHYVGMRTPQVEKIRPDTTCTEVCLGLIIVEVDHPEFIAAIFIDGEKLSDREVERFAVADGFSAGPNSTARFWMGEYFMRHHGPGEFIGYVIRWEPN